MRPILYMCGAALSLCNHNNNGSESTVVKTVELRRVVYHVAEPENYDPEPQEAKRTARIRQKSLTVLLWI
jgi:hypothetical protein